MAQKGLDELIDIKVTDSKISSNHFGVGWYSCAYNHYATSPEPITFPILEFATNDTQNKIAELTNNKSYPILLQTNYHNSQVYVLNIPDEYGSLEKLPQDVLNYIRKLCLKDFKLEVNGPAPFSVFLYDNETIILYNFTDHVGEYSLIIDNNCCKLQDFDSNSFITGDIVNSKNTFNFKINSHRFKVLKIVSN